MRGVERLDADRIARQKQPVGAGNRQRKHPVEQFHAARPVALIQSQNHFGIRARVHRPIGQVALPQCPVIVDLSVERNRVLLAENWLASAGDIDDSQPRVLQRAAFGAVQARSVRATMPQLVQHLLHFR